MHMLHRNITTSSHPSHRTQEDKCAIPGSSDASFLWFVDMSCRLKIEFIAEDQLFPNGPSELAVPVGHPGSFLMTQSETPRLVTSLWMKYISELQFDSDLKLIKNTCSLAVVWSSCKI